MTHIIKKYQYVYNKLNTKSQITQLSTARKTRDGSPKFIFG